MLCFPFFVNLQGRVASWLYWVDLNSCLIFISVLYEYIDFSAVAGMVKRVLANFSEVRFGFLSMYCIKLKSIVRENFGGTNSFDVDLLQVM